MEKHFRFGLHLLTHIKYYFEIAPINLKHKIIGSIFPEKLIFDGKKYRTTKENLFLSLLSSKQRDFKLLEKRKATPEDGLSNLALPLGLEPRTL